MYWSPSPGFLKTKLWKAVAIKLAGGVRGLFRGFKCANKNPISNDPWSVPHWVKQFLFSDLSCCGQFEHSTNVVINVQQGLASISLWSWKKCFSKTCKHPLLLCNKILTVDLSQYRRSQRHLCTTPIMMLASHCLHIQSGIIIYLVTFLLFTPETSFSKDWSQVLTSLSELRSVSGPPQAFPWRCLNGIRKPLHLWKSACSLLLVLIVDWVGSWLKSWIFSLLLWPEPSRWERSQRPSASATATASTPPSALCVAPPVSPTCLPASPDAPAGTLRKQQADLDPASFRSVPAFLYWSSHSFYVPFFTAWVQCRICCVEI